mgnify:CR=1 FL=1
MAYAILRHTSGVVFVRSIGGTLVISSGQLQLPDGTAAAPSYSFTNDTNFGMARVDSRVAICANAEHIASFSSNTDIGLNIELARPIGWGAIGVSAPDTMLIRSAVGVVQALGSARADTATLRASALAAGTGGTAFTVNASGVVKISNTVAAAAAVASTHKVTMNIGGTSYYLLAEHKPYCHSHTVSASSNNVSHSP